MAFDVKASLQRLQSYVAASGYFAAGHQIGEPKGPPSTSGELFAAIWMNSATVVGLYANGGTREVHTATIRVYRNMLDSPAAIVEEELAKAVSLVVQDFLADADLGTEIMKIDAAGSDSGGLVAEWGHVDVSNLFYRIVDIIVPMIVNDSATVTE